MKRYLLLNIFVLFNLAGAIAQLTIDDCYRMARENYPLLKQYDLVAKTRDYNVSNAGKGYLPQIKVTGKASYQSEVTKIPVDVPGMDIPTLNKDQYMAQVVLEQVIWDGGAIASQKNISKSAAEVNEKQLDVDMYAIKERVNQLFFGILLLDAQLEQIDLYTKELERNYNKINSYISNGIANQSDLDVIRVEMLKTEQQQSTILLTRKSYLEILSIFIGETLGEKTELTRPLVSDVILDADISSPELDLFSAKYRYLEEQKSLLNANYMPKIGLFTQGGYGRPALNMLKSDFRGFYIAGVNLTWNISNFYTKKNNFKLIDLNQEIVENQKETFLFNKRMELTQDRIAIEQQRKLLQKDDEIIRLRGNVKNAAEAKLENGIITVSDLIKEVIAEDLARQDMILHEIKYLQAVYKLKYTINN